MRIFDIAFKDFWQIYRDKKAWLFLLAMPVLFTIFMGFAYRSGEAGGNKDTRLSLGWVNQDMAGLLTERLQELLAASEAVKLVEVDPLQVNEKVQQGKLAGALLVPVNYSGQIRQGVNSQLTLVANTTTASGQTVYQTVRAAITQVLGSAEISRLSGETTGKAGDVTEFNLTFAAASQAWQDMDSIELVRVDLATAEPDQAWYGDNPYNMASPGILVQFAIMGLVSCGQILFSERKLRTLQRMLTTSLHTWQIIAGHLMAMFACVFIQVALLIVFGQIALQVNYLRQPLAILAISVALSGWVAALGLLISVAAKDDSQVVLFSLMAMFIFSALGGAWFPLETTGGLFAAIGRWMPSGMAMTGYQNILIRGLGSESAATPTLALCGYALFFFLASIGVFIKSER